MRSLLLLSVAAVLFASTAAAAPRWSELEGYTYDDYLRDFPRSYSPKHMAVHRAQFERTIREIREHNAKPGVTYKMGVNQFTDWTREQKAALNSYRPPSYESLKGLPRHREDIGLVGNVPKYLDWRQVSNPAVVSPVKNQGSCGSCWAFSATETMESRFALTIGELPVLSPQQINSCTGLGTTGCGGGDFFAAWQYLQTTTGQNEEFVYPYTDFFAQDTEASTSPCVNITAEWSSEFYWFPKAAVVTAVVVQPNSTASLMHAIASAGPVSIVVAAQQWFGYEGGIFVCDPTDPVSWQLDHAVQVVGYGHDFALAMDYWIVRNSWGTTWGEMGYIRLSRPAVEPCGQAQGWNMVVCGTSGLLSMPGYPIVNRTKNLNV